MEKAITFLLWGQHDLHEEKQPRNIQIHTGRLQSVTTAGWT